MLKGWFTYIAISCDVGLGAVEHALSCGLSFFDLDPYHDLPESNKIFIPQERAQESGCEKSEPSL